MAKSFVTQSSKAKKGGRDGSALNVSHLFDQRFHVTQIFLERAATGGGQFVFGLRQASLEKLRAGNVACLFEFARVHTQVSIGRTHQTLQIAEGQRFIRREGTDDPEPQSLVNQTIEVWSRALFPRPGSLRIRRLGERFLGNSLFCS